MKRHELIGHLQRQGCSLDREGGRHSIYTNPVNGAKAPIPRHAEIDNRELDRSGRTRNQYWAEEVAFSL